TAGRSGLPYSWQAPSSVSCTQGTPAGLPSGMPGMGEEMEAAMQQAAHPTRHSMDRHLQTGPAGLMSYSDGNIARGEKQRKNPIDRRESGEAYCWNVTQR